MTLKSGSVTVSVFIGNSDDKLSQKEWSDFWTDVDETIQFYTDVIHFVGTSLPIASFQNASWCFEIDISQPLLFGDDRDTKKRSAFHNLQRDLARLAARYRQDSIAWHLVGQVEFLGPEED